ncbi:hypothetical protein EMGBS4_06050 [Acidimicrobiaceae bacterium]|nr:hypothetical protein EMGBS4_06050 [Acidimicrobiaceae bacterium]
MTGIPLARESTIADVPSDTTTTAELSSSQYRKYAEDISSNEILWAR